MNKIPLVSIIITNYNLGKYLEDCIKSAINQDYINKEIVLIDDGSTDIKTINILKKLESKYSSNVIFIKQKNSGAASARNKGISQSKGKFICCLDGDDLISKQYVSKAIQLFNSDVGLGFVTSWVKIFKDEKKDDYQIWKTSDFHPIKLAVENIVHVSSIFRKSAWKKINGYWEELKGYEDWEFWIRMISFGYKWKIIEEPLFLYRKRNNSKVSISNNNREYLLKKIITHNAKYYVKNMEQILTYNDKRFMNLIQDKNKKMSTNKKIAFLLGSPEVSGGTYVIFKHALAMLNKGYEVTIITKEKIEISSLNWFEDAKNLSFLTLKEASHEQYDLCIVTWWKTVFYLTHINSLKFAYFVQSIETKFYPESEILLKDLIESTYEIPFYFITEASWIQKYLKKEHGKESYLVLNGIDKESFNTSGKVIDEKRPLGTRVLVEGALNVFFKQTELAVKIAKNAGVSDIWLLTPNKINKFPGVNRLFSNIPIKTVGEVMRSCDILLKLSKVEGMFGPPLEMMHCGGTAVVFNVTGHDEYIEDGKNGLVYEMDDFENITKGLNKLINDWKYIKKLKENGLKTAASWPDWKESSNNFIQKIEDILKDDKEQSICQIKSMVTFSEKIYEKNMNKFGSIKNMVNFTIKRILKKI